MSTCGPTLACADCGTHVPRRSPSQRYCPVCSGARDDARKAAWSKANPQAPKSTEAARRQRSDMKGAGADRSTSSRASMAWLAGHEVCPVHAVRVAVPFDWAASKNATWRTGRGGHVYAKKEGMEWRHNLTWRLREAGGEWYQGKVWIDIFVEKPNHRGDATNLVDTICDAVKDAIGVDDNWYSIRRLDWSIVKHDPRVFVGVAQEVTEDHQICSHCGRELLLREDFGLNRSTKTGFTRVCKDCSAPKRGRRGTVRPEA